MTNIIARRRFLQAAPLTLATLGAAPDIAPEVPATFPQQEQDMVREIVGVSHK